MSTLTISSPGVQINEVDLSITAQPLGATNILIAGFANQGPTNELTNIGSITEYQSVFGTPTNAAERYLYYTAAQVLNTSPANLLVSRMPYGSGAGLGYANSYSALVYPVQTTVTSTALTANCLTGYNDFSSQFYSVAPSIDILGGGVGGVDVFDKAQAHAVLYTNGLSAGLISAIHIDYAGSGYVTIPTINIVGAVSGNSTPVVYTTTGKIGNKVTGYTSDYTSASAYNLGAPRSILLSDEQYEQLIQGDITWNQNFGSTTSSSLTSFEQIGNAGLVVVNKTKTAVDDLFEGYYVGIADVSDFNPSTGYNSITGVQAAVSNNSNVYQNLSSVPSTRFNFKLNSNSEFGGTSISEIIENYPVGYNLAVNNNKTFQDTLVLVLFKIATSQYNQDTISLSYSVAEGYAGSLNANRTQNNTKGGKPLSFFLDTVVNNNSTNLNVITNPFIANATGWTNSDGLPSRSVKLNGEAKNLYSVGTYSSITDKNTNDVGNIPLKIDNIVNILENNETINVDVILEAGLGTIWTSALLKATETNGVDGNGVANAPYIFDETYYVDLGDLKNNNGTPSSGDAYVAYSDVLSIFNTLATNTRKDHIFIADPLRNIFVQGKNAKVASSKSFVFSDDIYWPLNNLYSAINSSYVAVYGNWILTNDAFLNQNVWLPSSGYVGAVIASSAKATYPWIAPAGLNRGKLSNVTDLAVNPTQKQRDLLYKISVNPIAYFPGEGYVIYGQKTKLSQPSAFDRINVRQLFLTLEKETQRLLKYYVFEPNTFSTRTRLKAALSPIFNQAKLNDGLYDYLLICDNTNNTPDIIDANELKISIYIQPVRAAEFILADFIATTTGVNFTELVGQAK